MFGYWCVVSIKKSFKKTLDPLSVSVSSGFNILWETVSIPAAMKFSIRFAEQKLILGFFYWKFEGFSAHTLNTEHYFFSESLSDQTYTIWHWHFLTFSVTVSLVSNAHTKWIKPNIKIQTNPNIFLPGFQFTSHFLCSCLFNCEFFVSHPLQCSLLSLRKWIRVKKVLCALTMQNAFYLRHILALQPCCM